MIRFLIDSSAVWRLLRDDKIRSDWEEVIAAHGVGSCQPQRTEFRRSARNRDDYEQMGAMFGELYPDVPLPKTAWQWVEAAQFRLLHVGAHRALSCVDLLVCACAASRGLTIVHDDKDFLLAAQHLPDITERPVHAPLA